MVNKHLSHLPVGNVMFDLLNGLPVPMDNRVGYLYRGIVTGVDGTRLGAYNVLVSIAAAHDGARVELCLDAAAEYVAANGDITSFDTDAPRLLISTRGLQVEPPPSRQAH